jgi:hypothetical protein
VVVAVRAWATRGEVVVVVVVVVVVTPGVKLA